MRDRESGNKIDAGRPAASLSRDQGPAPIDATPGAIASQKPVVRVFQQQRATAAR